MHAHIVLQNASLTDGCVDDARKVIRFSDSGFYHRYYSLVMSSNSHYDDIPIDSDIIGYLNNKEPRSIISAMGNLRTVELFHLAREEVIYRSRE